MNAETAPTGGAGKGPNLGAMIKMLLKESKGEAYVSVEGVIPHPAPCRTVARSKHSPSSTDHGYHTLGSGKRHCDLRKEVNR